MSKDKVSLIQRRNWFVRANDTCKDCGLVVWEFEKVKGERSLVLFFEGLLYDMQH